MNDNKCHYIKWQFLISVLLYILFLHYYLISYNIFSPKYTINFITPIIKKIGLHTRSILNIV